MRKSCINVALLGAVLISPTIAMAQDPAGGAAAGAAGGAAAGAAVGGPPARRWAPVLARLLARASVRQGRRGITSMWHPGRR